MELVCDHSKRPKTTVAGLIIPNQQEQARGYWDWQRESHTNWNTVSILVCSENLLVVRETSYDTSLILRAQMLFQSQVVWTINLSYLCLTLLLHSSVNVK